MKKIADFISILLLGMLIFIIGMELGYHLLR